MLHVRGNDVWVLVRMQSDARACLCVCVYVNILTCVTKLPSECFHNLCVDRKRWPYMAWS